MIIWDELKYGEQIYNNKKINSKKYEYKELKCLIKYMLHNNFKIKDIKDKLLECCSDNIQYLSVKDRYIIFNKLIEKSRKENEKKLTMCNKKITIYQEELNSIHQLDNFNLEKILFVMLVYCKWLGNPKWFFVLNIDLLRIAKLTHLSSKPRQALLQSICCTGLAEADLKGSRKNKNKKHMWSLSFVQNEGNIAFEFDNFVNVVYRYVNYINDGGYFECKNCNGMFIKRSNRHRYCNRCYKQIEKNQIRLRVQKYRNNK